MAGLASTYGIDPVDLANKTVAFMQGGMSKGQAMNTAATSFQNSSGFQSWQTGYLQGGYLDRDISAVLGKAVGLDTEGIAKNDPKAIAALRSMQQKASKGYGTDAGREERAKLQVAGFGQSTYNINSPETSRFLGARMTPGLPQQGELDKFNTARKNAVNGNADAGEVSNGFKDLVNTTSHANITIHDLSGNLSIFGKKILELKNRMDDPTTRKIGSTHSGI